MSERKRCRMRLFKGLGIGVTLELGWKELNLCFLCVDVKIDLSKDARGFDFYIN